MCWTVCGGGWSRTTGQGGDSGSDARGVEIRRHRYHGGQSADVPGQGRVAGKEGCREGRLPRPPGPWCRKKGVIRSEPNVGASEFAKQESGVRRTAVRRGGFRDADNEVAMGDGRAPAWRFSARIRRWREAPSRKSVMHRSKNGEPLASVSSHGWRWREAPRHGLRL